MRSPYEGPLFAAYPSEEIHYQFGVRMPNGQVVLIGPRVKAPLNQLVKRRMVPIEDWKEVASDRADLG